jgi:hypothetical protein
MGPCRYLLLGHLLESDLCLLYLHDCSTGEQEKQGELHFFEVVAHVLPNDGVEKLVIT